MDLIQYRPRPSSRPLRMRQRAHGVMKHKAPMIPLTMKVLLPNLPQIAMGFNQECRRSSQKRHLIQQMDELFLEIQRDLIQGQRSQYTRLSFLLYKMFYWILYVTGLFRNSSFESRPNNFAMYPKQNQEKMNDTHQQQSILIAFS